MLEVVVRFRFGRQTTRSILQGIVKSKTVRSVLDGRSLV
jgi:hypothetical protein